MSGVIELPAAGISGHITLKRWRPDGTNTEVREFTNLITDNLLKSRLGDHATVVSIREAMAYCRVGTSNTVPTAGDTALGAQVASTNTVVDPPTVRADYDDAGRGYVALTQTLRFGQGVAAGTLQEVGYGSSASSDILMSRALIRDSAGVATPLVVTAADFVDATYEVRLYTKHTPTDVVQTAVTIDGSNYDLTIRPVGAPAISELVTDDPTADWTSFNTKSIRHLAIEGDANAWLGAFDASETMPAVEDAWGMGDVSSVIDANTVLSAYVANSNQRDITVTIPAGELTEAGGISYLRLSTSEGSWGISFNPVLPKTAGKSVTLSVNVQAIQRYAP